MANEIYQFMIENKPIAMVFICIIAAVLIYAAVKLIQSVGMEKVRATVYKAFVYAENNFKQGDNDTKFEYVVNIAKSAIPSPFNFFITENLLRDVIQLWFDLCKDLLDDGRMNKSATTTIIDNPEENQE